MALTQLNHVTVRTDDLEATRDFYNEVLGLAPGPLPARFLVESPLFHG